MQNLPTNYNLLQPTSYRLIIDKLPLVSYWAQSVQLPGAQVGETQLNTPFKDFPMAGDNINHDIFDIMFLIDEQMANWNELYKWMRQLTSPSDFKKEFKTLPQDPRYNDPNIKEMYSDARLHITTNSMNPNIVIKFTSMFPTVLTPISFESSDTTLQPLLGTCSFTVHDMIIET